MIVLDHRADLIGGDSRDVHGKRRDSRLASAGAVDDDVVHGLEGAAPPLDVVALARGDMIERRTASRSVRQTFFGTQLFVPERGEPGWRGVEACDPGKRNRARLETKGIRVGLERRDRIDAGAADAGAPKLEISRTYPGVAASLFPGTGQA